CYNITRVLSAYTYLCRVGGKAVRYRGQLCSDVALYRIYVSDRKLKAERQRLFDGSRLFSRIFIQDIADKRASARHCPAVALGNNVYRVCTDGYVHYRYRTVEREAASEFDALVYGHDILDGDGFFCARYFFF